MKDILVKADLLEGHHCTQMKHAFPGHNITFYNTSPPLSALKNASIIFGNIPSNQLIHCEKLELLQLFSAGTYDYLQFLPSQTILTNASGAYGLAISEHLLALLLSLMKKLPTYHNQQLEGVWKDAGTVTSIHGSRILIWGLGNIGSEFAKKTHALGAHTIGVRRIYREKPAFLSELCSLDEIDQLLPTVDVVSMSLPSTPKTKDILSKRRISLMKQGAFLLNAGRGDAVDSHALADALNSGKLGGAGLDVTEPEPLPFNHFLWKAKNAIITPHVGGGNHLPETVNRIVSLAIANGTAYLEGAPLTNQVDITTGYRKIEEDSYGT